MKYLLKFVFPLLRSGVEARRGVKFCHSMLSEFGKKWGTECLDTRFPLPTLLCAGIQREANLSLIIDKDNLIYY